MATLVEPQPDTQPAVPTREPGPHQVRFDRLAKLAQDPPWVASARKSAFARFAALGLPTVQDEDWRFTNVAPLAGLPFRPILSREHRGLTPAGIANFFVPALPGRRLVFVDGHFAAPLSSLGTKVAGVKVINLAQAVATDGDILEQHLASYARPGDNAFDRGGERRQDG